MSCAGSLWAGARRESYGLAYCSQNPTVCSNGMSLNISVLCSSLATQ